MPRVFICVENPASAIGDKSGNRRPGKDKQKAKKIDQKALKAKQQVWQQRQNLLTAEEVEAEVDGSRDKEVKLVSQHASIKPDVCWASTGSLRTMLAELKHAAAKGKFDTIIFMGHGAAGCMSVGDGKMGDLIPSENRKRQAMIDAYDQDKRTIGINNAQIWSTTFSEISDCLTTGEKGRLHVFLLGCSTGVQQGITTLQQTVATTLAASCNLRVAAYGTSGDIEIDQTSEILANLNVIEKGAGAGATYQLKTSTATVICAVS